MSLILYVLINAVNDPPGIKMMENTPDLVTDEDTVLNIHGLEVFDPDVDEGGMEMLNVTFEVPHGTFHVADPRLLKYMDDGKLSNSINFLNVIADPPSLNNALNSLQYTPSSNFHGNVTLKVFIDDMESFGSGGSLSSTSEFIIQVRSVVDPPIIDCPFSLDLSMDEDSTLDLMGIEVKEYDGEAQSMYIVTMSCDYGNISVLSKASTLQLLHFTSGTYNNGSNIEFYGNLEHVQDAIYNLQYKPRKNFNTYKFLSEDTINIQVTRIHARDLMSSDAPYIRTKDDTSSIQITVLVEPITDFIEFHFNPKSYTMAQNNILTDIGYMLEDPDINDEDFESGSGIVIAEVEFYISVKDGFISIMTSGEIPNVVVMIENEKDLTRWKTPKTSPWHKAKSLRFRSDIKGVRNVMDSLVYEPLPDRVGNDTILFEIFRVVDMKGIIVDAKDSIAVGFVSRNITIAVLEEVKN